MNKFIKGGIALFSVGAMLTSCNFIDMEPLDQISPDKYYTKADQLGTFTLNYYTAIFVNPINWQGGVIRWDDGTDNQAAGGGNTSMFLQDKWLVPTSGGIGFDNIRNVNKFINETEAKEKEGKIEGDKVLINHYIGEAYFIRAMLYFDKLKTYGDYPILLEEKNVNDSLAELSKRAPRNEVARQIIADLDKAVSLLQETMENKQRITKDAALAAKSRVALYEGTFEKYHSGSGRVPGDANWPGKDKEWNKGKTFNQPEEVKFFLTQAMDAAKTVASKLSLTESSHKINPENPGEYSGWNQYYDMFSDKNLGTYPEVILWREFSVDEKIAHLTSNKLRLGSATGWTRGLVESFLMKNGLPIYNEASGYKGDKTIDKAKEGRDERLGLFVFGESDVIATDQASIDAYNKDNEDPKKLVPFVAPILVNTNAEVKDITGYRQRKFMNYDPSYQNGQTFSDLGGQIIFRVAELMLNYIEADYVLDNTLDETSKGYWKSLRARAGITEDIQKTIDATDMNKETTRPSYDWGAFSAGKAIDKTLYSIRRERRCEFAGEGYRMDDLIRWRALDQVKNYQIEGVNLWDKIYSYPAYKVENEKTGKIEDIIIADGGEKANLSSKEVSKYLRPYQVRKTNNELYNGYTFYQAHYLSPFSVAEMLLCSPDGSIENTYLYQNIYWPTTASGKAEK